MPWTETAPMKERMRFVTDVERGLYSMMELCERYGVSRKTGYKWLARYEEEGADGLRERSRAPHHCPHRIAPAIADAICGARRQHPSWGPEKILQWLGRKAPEWKLPAISTAGDLLARRGLVKKRRRRRAYTHPGVVPPTTAQPNDLGTADFKGHFRTRDGVCCYPLTVADQHSRYLLACQGLRSTQGVGVRPVFDRLFHEYGLPRAIRTDNGVPFATTGIHGLSQLNVWWMSLGMQHQRILPGHPQQNGAHERNASYAQGCDRAPPAVPPGQSTARLHALSPSLQRGAPPSIPRRAHAGLGLPGLTAPVHRAGPAVRVPWPLPDQACDQCRDDPAQVPVALSGQRAQAAYRRPRGSGRWHLVHPFLQRPAGSRR